MELWYEPRECDFSRDNVIFLLHHYEELSNGKYPIRPSSYTGGNKSRNNNAPFQTAVEIKSELDLRLGQTPFICEGLVCDRKTKREFECRKYSKRCSYRACWQLSRKDGRLLILELSTIRINGQTKDWEREEKYFEDLIEEEQNLISFIASGRYRRRLFYYEYIKKLRNRKEG